MCWPILYCALLRQSRNPVTVPNTLTQLRASDGNVLGMFPEPNIYAFVPHIFCIHIFRNLPSSSLVVRWLEYWRCNMYYLGLAYLIAGSAPSCNPTIAYLLPVCVCQFRVRSWRCDMYYCGWPIYTIPEYILVVGQPSSIILYKDSEEGYLNTHTQIYTSDRVAKCQYFYNRLHTWLF